MSPDWFDAIARALASARSRRRALALLLTATIGAAVSTDDPVNARKRLKRKPSTKSGKKHSGKKRKNRKGKKGNKGNKDKKSTSGSSGCAVHHSEQQILDFISQAAKKYGQPENAMVRVARCESSLNPCAVNRGGPYYGLYQYLKGTWKSTPYGDRDIFDPEAQALATGWMWQEGRRNEWACQ